MILTLIQSFNENYLYGGTAMLKLVKGEKVSSLLLSKELIATRVKELAAQINKDYEGKQVTLLGTLTGANIFLADLARELTVDTRLDFMKVSSYSGTESVGQVRLVHPPTLKLDGAHVIIVEDIIDTGHTAVFLRTFMESQNTASAAICSLLSKPSRRVVADVKCEYLGFEVENVFVVGYGLDYNQRYRNLPYIGILELEKEVD